MNSFLLIGVPYAAFAVAVGGGVVRYRRDKFSWSTQSSQFLENRTLFWGSNAWHYGILAVLAAHLAALVAPGWWSSLLGSTTRLYVLEVTGIGLAFLAGSGLTILIARRFFLARIARVTSVGDRLLLLALAFQVVTGLYVAIAYRWGGAWYPHTAVPWLRSLFELRPQIATMSSMPWPVKAHAVGGFAVLFLFPFTRLVHVVSYPVRYLWRPYQLVIWNRRAARP